MNVRIQLQNAIGHSSFSDRNSWRRAIAAACCLPPSEAYKSLAPRPELLLSFSLIPKYGTRDSGLGTQGLERDQRTRLFEFVGVRCMGVFSVLCSMPDDVACVRGI